MTREEYRRRNMRINLCIVAAFLLVMFCAWRRNVTYRKVIYAYETEMEASAPEKRMGAREYIERKVGRPNTPWYKLDHRPRYLHFWDEFNEYDQYYIDRLLYDAD